ncbi:antiviral RADAR system adenosine deaminase RdrB [Candidatus Symbiopectobacterium sp. NZEC135]|uniref:antiviral RADAR system adenosine deaminase RdrB n=1 Tax=Candidatus Symbiopectobacterium sp. NZEC135 TaxID=2820471 RepID=UPI0022265680|nr:antiviral RADAR system adenosine deaminase RdrB [Candidatus Symbiopectobacterium sp. NZEC135]MCW2480585.1 hypothetical protein [Candidatus Symbiopectobacterium sp. NZEC135]
MYSQDPRWLLPCVHLASDRLFYFYMQQHIGGKASIEAGVPQQNDLLLLAAKDYQFYFGGRLRKEDIKNNIQCWSLITQQKNHSSILTQLSNDFLLWKGNCFEVRRERLQDWLMLCSIIDPAWVIARAYVQLVKHNVLSEHELIDLLTGRQCPFAFPGDYSDTSYADNHVHFNGHGYTSLSMLTFLDGDYSLKSDIAWPNREEYHLFESEMLDKHLLPDWFSAYVNCLFSVIYPDGNSDTKQKNVSGVNYTLLAKAVALPLSVTERRMLRDLTQTYNIHTEQQKLLFAAVQKKYSGHQRWLLFCCGMMLDEHQSDYQSGLSNLIRISTILRNYMVVSSVGLGQFIEFFGAKIRRANPDYSIQQVVRYDLAASVSREYRVSPDFVIGNIRKLNIHHHKLTDFFTTHEEWHVPEKSHLVIHFTRGFPDKKHTQDKRLVTFRSNLLRQVRALENFSASVTLQRKQYQPDIRNPPFSIDLRRLIRGYDVAGNENELPIEVFAPVLRVLRAARHPAGTPLSIRLPQPFITVHAGEDYSHLLSGLRSIDEAVDFCQLREGDRIGHGLALGMDVNLWACRQRRAYLTAGQHLDNLVWAYHQAVQLSQHSAEHISVMHGLRDKIHHWSQRLFNDVYTPNLLHRAWLLRRNWPEYTDILLDSTNRKDWVPDIELLMGEQHREDEKAIKIWKHYLDSGLPEHENDWINHVISVNCLPEQIDTFSSAASDDEDIISPGELKLYEAIQDFLMEKYSRLGIVIEACPTSNIYIGRFEKYQEHPLFRWNPPHPDWLKPGGRANRYGLRSGPLAACINTDDCALMPTTIANEHRIIRETAVQCFGIGTWMADLWISSIREKGVSIFKSNHLLQELSNESNDEFC